MYGEDLIMNKTKRLILLWAPFAACFVFGVLALSLHHIACQPVNKVIYIQVPAGMLVPLVFPVIKRLLKVRVPYFIEVVVAVQIIISIDLGSALLFYNTPYYDKFLHTFFGVWCAQLAYYFINYFGGRDINKPFKLVLVALCVLGAAGVWEIFEFAMSNIIEGYDPQVWHAAVEGGANGGNPLWDTMYDMIVAVIGTAIFYITLAIDVATKGKLYRGTLDARREFSSDRDSEAVRAEGREQNDLCNGAEERSE